MAHGAHNGYFHNSFDEGHTFEEFAKSYGRQYGAYVLARDLPLGAELPEGFWEPNDYHLQALKRAELFIETYDSGDTEQLRPEFNEEIESRLRSYEQSIGGLERQISLAENWLEGATCMRPITEDQKLVTQSMIKDIKKAIEECKQSLQIYLERINDIRITTFQSWLNTRYDLAVRDCTYHREAYEREISTQLSRKAWHEGYMKMIAEANSLDRTDKHEDTGNFPQQKS